MTDLFVGNPYMHTFFRFAAIFFGIYVLYSGYTYGDKILIFIGLATVVTDSFTFYLSISAIQKKTPN